MYLMYKQWPRNVNNITAPIFIWKSFLLVTNAKDIDRKRYYWNDRKRNYWEDQLHFNLKCNTEVKACRVDVPSPHQDLKATKSYTDMCEEHFREILQESQIK